MNTYRVCYLDDAETIKVNAHWHEEEGSFLSFYQRSYPAGFDRIPLKTVVATIPIHIIRWVELEKSTDDQGVDD